MQKFVMNDIEILMGIFFRDKDYIALKVSKENNAYRIWKEVNKSNEKFILFIENYTKELEKVILHSNIKGAIVLGKKIDLNLPKNEFYIARNADKSIRFLNPLQSKEPIFLKLYNGAGLRGRIVKKIFKLGFLKTQMGMKKSFLMLIAKPNVKFNFDFFRSDFAIFTGTKGATRKAVICENKVHQDIFYKIPLTKKAKTLIAKEAKVLNALEKLKINSFQFPEVVKDNITGFSGPIGKSWKNLQDLSILHIAAIKELNDKTKQVKYFSETKNVGNIRKNIDSLNQNVAWCMNEIDISIAEKIAYQLELIYLEFLNDNSQLYAFSTVHGDFTPWNMLECESKIFIYDWEMSYNEGMPFFDICHYIIQTSVLIKKKKNIDILKELKKVFNDYQFDIEITDFNTWISFYLLSTVSFYLPRYLVQTPLHVQAHWLIDCWSFLLDEVIKDGTQKTLYTQVEKKEM